MKPNFPKVRVRYNDVTTKANVPLELEFEVSSINFDVNQATASPLTPFTSELSFNLRLAQVKQPSKVADLNALDKVIADLYGNKTPAIDTLTKAVYNSVLGGVELTFNPQPSTIAAAGAVQDLLCQNSVASTPYFASLSLQSNDTASLTEVTWLVQIKFLAEITVGFITLLDGKSTFNRVTTGSYILHPALGLKDGTNLSLAKGSEGDGPALNAELQLAYEVLFQSADANVTGTPLSNSLADTIGKVSDEISDSFSNLSATLADKLSRTVSTQLQPVGSQVTYDLALWVLIQKGTEALAFGRYDSFLNAVFCGTFPEDEEKQGVVKKDLGRIRAKSQSLAKSRSLPFMGVDAYRSLKVLTEAFVMVNCMTEHAFDDQDLDDLVKKVPLVNGKFEPNQLDKWWDVYWKNKNGVDGGVSEVIPYLSIIFRKLKEYDLKDSTFEGALEAYVGSDSGLISPTNCFGVIQQKLTNPCFLELIWSYWHEESMMVQGLNAIGRRFQNIKGPGAVDPLANLEIDPLRPLSNLIWGYIQDEQHRLTVRRRAYEYDHHYGISLQGTAVQNMRFADSRSKFIEAFHMLLHLTNKFYKQSDDVTVRPDGFPVLNALKETHLILSEGAHNQFGDLPSVARSEMLMQQWLLARPEFREFLPTRIMVAYPEPWMDRVSALNNVMGWTKTSVLHFRDLGVFGEQLLLSIRFGNWANVNDTFSASNWANFWRPQVQAYIHAYRAATGVDLTADVPGARIDSLQPSVHLQRRLLEQRGKAA